MNLKTIQNNSLKKPRVLGKIQRLKLPVSRYQECDNISFIKGGNEYFETLFNVIDQTNHTLHLQFYIIANDETGKLVVQHLKNAVNRGVEVSLVVDGYGSKSLSKPFRNEITQSGINFKMFNPVYSSKGYYFGRRLHQKIVVSDEKFVIIGGVNLADKYRGTHNESAWLDFALLIEGGAAVLQAHQICNEILNRGFKTKPHQKIKIEDNFNPAKMVRLVQNDWFRNKYQITRSYRSAFNQAEKSLVIVASYFLPSKRTMRLIRHTAKRGVEIKLILSGKSDVKIAQKATHYFYDFLLRNNVKIYEWSKSVLHGKTAIADGKWCTLGSYNLNFLSDYSSIELNVDTFDPTFIKTVESHLHEILGECELVDTTSHIKKRNIISRITDWMSYKLARFFMQTYFRLLTRNYLKKKGEDFFE